MVTQSRCGASLPVQETIVWVYLQLALLALLGTQAGFGPLAWFTGLTYTVATWIIFTAALRRSWLRSMGPANRVTLARAALVGAVTALVASTAGDGRTAHDAVLVMFATVALVLDAVDGKVARRTGTSSPFGARFDMEVDALLIMVLSIYVSTTFGGWVLSIGAMRYAFVAAAWVVPWLRSPLPPSVLRKTVAALQGIVLVVAGSGILPRPVAIAALGLALAALAWSFGRDILWLWQEARRHATAPA